MPELPDVEVYKRYVDATSLNRTITDLMVREQLVEDTDPQTIRDHLGGAKLTATRRHGKHLFIRGDEGWLQLHFGMTGYLDATTGSDPPEHTELFVEFEDGGRLAYVDQRKFGSIMWIGDVDEFIDQRGLGPDPIADKIDRRAFGDRLRDRSGSIKGTLMNQSVFAGLGNVYTDEILFQAGIHPESETGSLRNRERRFLLEVMLEVLEMAIKRDAEVDQLPGDWLLHHREPDAPCPRDGTNIQRIEVLGRATYLCPQHQKTA